MSADGRDVAAAASTRLGRPRTVGLFIVLVTICAALGVNAAANTTLVFAAILLVAALPLVNSRPTTWIALAVTVPWTSRLLTVLGSAPRILDFLDFPLVLVAFILAGVRYLNDGRRVNGSEQKIGRRLLLLAVVIALSWAFNDLREPQRLIAGWILALEPFLLLMALILTPMTGREHRRLFLLVTVLLCGQMLFSIPEILSGDVSDAVKGTLLAAGAGHHVSAGGLVVGFFVLARYKVPRLLVIAFGALALFVIVIADAKQVLFTMPLALLVFGVSARTKKSTTSLLGGVVAGLLMAAGSIYALLSYHASSTAFDFVDRSTMNGTGKFAVASALWGDITASLETLLFGLGPGETVSRFAFLTTPSLLKEGSPVALLGLHASRGADHYNGIALSGPYTGSSSFTSAQSSALGVLGDYGLAGMAAVVALILVVVGALRKSADRRLAAAAVASWTLLVPLAIVFDWLEQPPFTLAVMLISGLAIRSPFSSGVRELPDVNTSSPDSASANGAVGRPV